MQQSNTILIIDDDPFGRDALDMVLGSNGYEVAFAASGPEGLRRAAEIVPDLILLDVMMPGMDGFEVCRRIRSDSELAEVPVLLITALDDRASRLNGIRAGADDFITKPIDSVELLARVQGITRLNRYRTLLNQRRRFEWVLEQAEDGYLVLDAHDRIEYANPAARRYFVGEAGGGEIEGKPFVEVVRRRYQCEPVSAWEAWSVRPYKEQQSLYLIQPQLDTAPAVWFQVVILDQVSGEESQRLVRVQDVSAQMGTQQAMWAFQSMVRHKLNTPLHAMASCLELLTAHPFEQLPSSERDQLFEWMQDAMQRLQSSVAAVLRHAQAPELAGWGDHLDLQELPELAEQVGRTLDVTPLILPASEALTGPLTISRQALECVLAELLENAKKFHPSHAPNVTISVCRTTMPTGLDAVRVAVADNGTTLSATQIEKIWTPYYQGEARFTGEIPGMGLGLSLVRSLLWQVGGSCSASNREDGPGLVVEVWLPRHSSA